MLTDKYVIHIDKGYMYEKEPKEVIDYDEDYFECYTKYGNSPIAKPLNEFRVRFSHKYGDGWILDVGIGSGMFLMRSAEAGRYTFGTDVNPVAIAWLKARESYIDPYKHIPDTITTFTFWDTIEHFTNPRDILDLIKVGQYAVFSIPVIHDLNKVTESKHFKPGEHIYYFTPGGFIRYMTDLGFTLYEVSDKETRIGRNDIFSYAFKRTEEVVKDDSRSTAP